jgi:hypothetical protein
LEVGLLIFVLSRRELGDSNRDRVRHHPVLGQRDGGVAEIMTDEDSGGAVYTERALAFDEYEKAAARALRRLRVESQIGLRGGSP